MYTIRSEGERAQDGPIGVKEGSERGVRAAGGGGDKRRRRPPKLVSRGKRKRGSRRTRQRKVKTRKYLTRPNKRQKTTEEDQPGRGGNPIASSAGSFKRPKRSRRKRTIVKTGIKGVDADKSLLPQKSAGGKSTGNPKNRTPTGAEAHRQPAKGTLGEGLKKPKRLKKEGGVQSGRLTFPRGKSRQQVASPTGESAARRKEIGWGWRWGGKAQ